MNNLQVINQQTVLDKDFKIYGDFENPLFLAKDVAEWIEHSNVTAMLNSIDDDEKVKISPKQSLGQFTSNNEYNFLTEDGLYEVLMQSRKPIAKQFKKEVKKILKSLRTGQATLIGTDKLNAIKIQAQQDRAKAMLLNAQNRALKTLMTTIKDKNLSPIAVEVFGLKSIEQVTGVDMGNYLPQVERTYSATEIGKMIGVSANAIGKAANKHGLKTDKYGITVMDKSRHSAKEVPSFRYNDLGCAELKRIFSR